MPSPLLLLAIGGAEANPIKMGQVNPQFGRLPKEFVIQQPTLSRRQPNDFVALLLLLKLALAEPQPKHYLASYLPN